ncbi:unnamed protein product [Tetraodon nigroviridis]|uniref:Chromosome 15 SCAF14542, whole genome shotgun sequence n=1 Tax=Tetraodon nigroviridis TaxID=99883 RepID=Q4SP37_TETNG|nr:unnamed protein product [Tetraodon nigroviridis]
MQSVVELRSPSPCKAPTPTRPPCCRPTPKLERSSPKRPAQPTLSLLNCLPSRSRPLW